MSPYVSEPRTDGVNHWVVIEDDPNSPYAHFVNVNSFDIDELIKDLQEARQKLAEAGARMEVEQ